VASAARPRIRPPGRHYPSPSGRGVAEDLPLHPATRERISKKRKVQDVAVLEPPENSFTLPLEVPLSVTAPPVPAPRRAVHPIHLPGASAPVRGGDNKKQKPSLRLTSRLEVRDDDLGKHVRAHTAMFQQLGWRATVQKIRPRGDLQRNQHHWHPASPLLRHFAKCGAPAVLSSAPWPPELLDERILRGSHQSCNDNKQFIREELTNFVNNGYWFLLPYRLVKHMRQLRISPLGVVPQRERRPRLIVEYSY